MRTFWLALFCAAAVLPVSSAAAVSDAFDVSSSRSSVANVRVHRGDGAGIDRPRVLREVGAADQSDGRWGDGRRDRRRWRGSDVYVQDYYGGDWAYYNNRSWQADSYNDWWHERPERSMPRWLQRNRNCQRRYWSGGGWTC